VSETLRSPLNPLAPSLSALMCDGMGWFSKNDFKRMLLFYDQILYLVPSRTAEFRDIDGQPKYIMFSKQRQEIGFQYQHYRPDDVMADVLFMELDSTPSGRPLRLSSRVFRRKTEYTRGESQIPTQVSVGDRQSH
jgi:hypothetical protein